MSSFPRLLWGSIASASDTPNACNWYASAMSPRAYWATLVLSKQSMQFVLSTPCWNLMLSFYRRKGGQTYWPWKNLPFERQCLSWAHYYGQADLHEGAHPLEWATWGQDGWALSPWPKHMQYEKYRRKCVWFRKGQDCQEALYLWSIEILIKHRGCWWRTEEEAGHFQTVSNCWHDSSQHTCVLLLGHLLKIPGFIDDLLVLLPLQELNCCEQASSDFASNGAQIYASW